MKESIFWTGINADIEKTIKDCSAHLSYLRATLVHTAKKERQPDAYFKLIY